MTQPNDDMNREEVQNIEPVQEPQGDAAPAKKKRNLLRLIPVAAVLMLVILGAFLWQPILLNLAPNLYTTIVINNTMTALEKRANSGLGEVIGDAGEILTDGSIDIEIKGRDEYNGRELDIRLSLMAELKKKKAQLGVNYSDTIPETQAQFDLYLDADRLAIRSPMVGNQFYGFEYDDFARELKNSGMSKYLSDEQIEQYDQLVQRYDELLSDELDADTILKPYVKILEDFIQSLEPERYEEEIELDGDRTNCTVISYTLSQSELTGLMNDLINEMEGDTRLRDLMLGYEMSAADDADAQAIWAERIEDLRVSLPVDDAEAVDSKLLFYVYRSHVAAIELTTGVLDEESKPSMRISFGKNPKTSDIIFESNTYVFGTEQSNKLVFSSSEEKNVSTYWLTFNTSMNGIEDETVCQVTWDRKEETVTIKTGEGEHETLTMGLKEIDKGYQLTIEDYQQYAFEPVYYDACITLQKNASIETPEYITLGNMDMEAIDALMSAIGYDDSSLGMTPKVLDYCSVLSQTDLDTLESHCRDLVREYGVDMAVAVIDEKTNETLYAEACWFYLVCGFGFGDHEDGYMIMVEKESAEVVLVQMGETFDDLSEDQNAAIVSKMQQAIDNGSTVYDALAAGLLELEQAFSDIYGG